MVRVPLTTYTSPRLVPLCVIGLYVSLSFFLFPLSAVLSVICFQTFFFFCPNLELMVVAFWFCWVHLLPMRLCLYLPFPSSRPCLWFAFYPISRCEKGSYFSWLWPPPSLFRFLMIFFHSICSIPIVPRTILFSPNYSHVMCFNDGSIIAPLPLLSPPVIQE